MMHSRVAAFVLSEIMQHSCQETKAHNPLFNCIFYFFLLTAVPTRSNTGLDRPLPLGGTTPFPTNSPQPKR